MVVLQMVVTQLTQSMRLVALIKMANLFPTHASASQVGKDLCVIHLSALIPKITQ